VFCKKFLETPLSKVMFLFLARRASNTSLEINTEVRNDVIIPITNVVAKPCTGPEPNRNSTTPVMIVVRLPSMIAE